MVCIIVVVVSCELLSQLGRVPLTHILETWFEILMLACFASLLAKRCCPKILPGYYILHIQQLHSQYLYIFGRDLDLQIFEHDLAWVYPGFFLVKIIMQHDNFVPDNPQNFMSNCYCYGDRAEKNLNIIYQMFLWSKNKLFVYIKYYAYLDSF